MSQKYKALQQYEELKREYDCETRWHTQATVAVSLVPIGEEVNSNRAAIVDTALENLMADVDLRFTAGSYPLFVRACPLVPRPGVLESSRADTSSEVRTIAKRIMDKMMSPDTSPVPMYEHGFTDPHGTIMVQPFVQAHASAVVAPDNYIMMGPNHDGVTAGNKDNFTVALPLINCSATNNDLRRMKMNPSNIEIEFVSQKQEITERGSLRTRGISQRSAMVQLRGSEGHRPIASAPKGVTISGTFHGDERINIKHIHIVGDDTEEQLNEMEDALREGMPEGSVVLHPMGSHLSHHAGQCFKYGVPYIASAEPQVGEQWTQAALGWVVLDNDGSYEPQPYDPLDFADQFINGFNAGFTNFARQHGWLSNHFHQFIGGPIDDPARTAHYAGAYVSWLINATLSVGFGELRHLHTHAKQSTVLANATIVALFGKDRWVETTGMSNTLSDTRQEYYMMLEDYPLTTETVIGMLEFAMNCYSLQWNSSYGGLKYKLSCKNARNLLQSVITFIDNQTEEAFKQVIAEANLTEHNVHNSGFFFNKFLPQKALEWGTDSSKIDLTKPDAFFSVYYAAEDVYNVQPRTPLDLTSTLERMKGITVNDMRATPLGERDDEFGVAVSYLSSGMRHPSGRYSDISSPFFVKCGVANCNRCEQHKKEHTKQLSSEMLKIVETYDASFPYDENISAKPVLKDLATLVNAGKQLPETTPNDLAYMFNNNLINDDMHKYVTLIVSNFTDEQLKEFAELKED